MHPCKFVRLSVSSAARSGNWRMKSCQLSHYAVHSSHMIPPLDCPALSLATMAKDIAFRACG